MDTLTFEAREEDYLQRDVTAYTASMALPRFSVARHPKELKDGSMAERYRWEVQLQRCSHASLLSMLAGELVIMESSPSAARARTACARVRDISDVLVARVEALLPSPDRA